MRLLPVACCAALLALPGAARARDPYRPGLNWVRLPGAEGCLSAAQLAERVELRVGRMLFAGVSEADLFVDGYVQPVPSGWAVALEVWDRGGARLGRRELRFEGAACSAIDEAVTLVIAVTLYPNTSLLESGIALDPSITANLQELFGDEPADPDLASLPAQPPQATSAPPAQPTRVAADAGDAAGAAPRVRGEPLQFGADAAFVVALGQLPGFAAGAALYLRVRPPSVFAIEVGALLLPGATASAAGAEGSARFDLLLGSLAVCPIEPSWLRAAALCAGAEVGQLDVEPSGFASEQRAASDVVANLLLTALYRPQLVAGLHLRAAASLAVPLVQRAYVFEALDGTAQPLFRIPQLAGRFDLGLALRF